MAGELWLAGYFKGSVREVCAGSEDILLSEVTAGMRARVIGRAFCAKRSERK